MAGNGANDGVASERPLLRFRLDFCVACSATDDLNHHHFVPRVHGGL
jgi:hypothetical protein